MITKEARGTIKLIVAFTILMGASFAAEAQWLPPGTSSNYFNFTFTGEPYGTYSATGPQMYSDIFPASDNNTTITIGDAPGISKGVIINNAGGTAHLSYGYLDQYPANGATPTVLAAHGVYSFDINQLVNSLDAGPAYGGYSTAVEAYISGVGWIWGFALDATSAAGGNILLEGPGFSVGPTIGAYTTGTTYHVTIDNNYLTGTYDVKIDGNLAAYQLPFVVTPTSTNQQIKEIFVYNVTAGTGDQNVTAFDNFLYTIEAPEPSSILMSAIGLITLGVISRRARRTV